MRAVVIGTGPAGITAAITLRRLDPTGSVVALSTEPFAPYSPPAMADHFLTGREDTLFWKERDVAERFGIDERRAARVVGVDTDSHEVELSGGERIGFEGLVVASGSRVYAPLDGADLPGVLDFKSLSAATELIERVRRGEAKSALIVGNGFIGIELSLLLADLGVDVTVIGRRRWVMPRVLDPVTSTIAETALKARGVTLRLGVQAEAIVGDSTATGVRLADGSRLDADLVVAATGVKPHTEFLEGTEIQTGWGIYVDDGLATSVPGIVAAGDVAEAADWRTGERYVHAIFPNAVTQAPIAVANLLGAGLRYDGAEAMNSLKHLGVPIVAMGSIADFDEVLRWQDGGDVRAVYLSDGRVVGAQLAGDISAAGVYHSLMMRRAPVDHYGPRLVEPGFGMADVAFDAMRYGPPDRASPICCSGR
ncbi:MAG TPA: FAD-dependent oxidoreductase [Acidimicrobiales bacterium]|nr:FAD-dependent oxidoreductase [Acidimicrobiales bacterium]